MFSTLCTVKADMSQLASVLKPQHGRGGAIYYQHYFDIVLLFGLTELKAQISWTEHVRDLSAFVLQHPLIYFTTGPRKAASIIYQYLLRPHS